MSEAIRNLFASIARRYDVANNAISFGMHRGWKRRLVSGGGADTTLWGRLPAAHGDKLSPPQGRQTRLSAPPIVPGARVLDCACGTGDVAYEALRRVLPGGKVVGVDFTPEMIDLARAKIAHLDDGWLEVPGEADVAKSAIRFEIGDVLNLPYPDDTFEAATIAFGIRNVDDPLRGLTEMARVVKPGGAVLILESGMPPNRVWRRVYSLYQSSALWMIGGVLSGNIAAYRYLAATTRRFPSGPEFVALMESTGTFGEIRSVPLLGGVAWIYRGTAR